MSEEKIRFSLGQTLLHTCSHGRSIMNTHIDSLIEDSISGFQTPPTLDGLLRLNPDRFAVKSGLGQPRLIEGDLWGVSDPLELDDPEPSNEVEVLVTRLVLVEDDNQHLNANEQDALDVWGVDDSVEREDRISGVYPTHQASLAMQSHG